MRYSTKLSPDTVTWLPAIPLVIMHKTGRVISAEGIVNQPLNQSLTQL